MIDTKTTVFTIDGEILGVFNLSDEQQRLLDWLYDNNAFNVDFVYDTFDSVEDM